MLPPPATAVALAIGWMHCVVLPVAEATPGDCTAAAYVAYDKADLPPTLKASIPAACRTCLDTNTTCESRTPNATAIALMNEYGHGPLTPCCPPGDLTCGNDPTQPPKTNLQVSCQYDLDTNRCVEQETYISVLGDYPTFNSSATYYLFDGGPCTQADYTTDPSQCYTRLDSGGGVDYSSQVQRATTTVLNPQYKTYRCWRGVDQCPTIENYGCDWGDSWDAFVYNWAGVCLPFSGNVTACRTEQGWNAAVGTTCIWDASQPAWQRCMPKRQLFEFVKAMDAWDASCKSKTDNATCSAVQPAGACTWGADYTGTYSCTSGHMDVPPHSVQTAMRNVGSAPTIVSPPGGSSAGGSSLGIIVVVLLVVLAVAGVAFMKIKNVGPFAPKAAVQGGIYEEKNTSG